MSQPKRRLHLAVLYASAAVSSYLSVWPCSAQETPVPVGCEVVNGTTECAPKDTPSDDSLGWEITLVAVCGVIVILFIIMTQCRRRMKEKKRLEMEKQLLPSFEKRTTNSSSINSDQPEERPGDIGDPADDHPMLQVQEHHPQPVAVAAATTPSSTARPVMLPPSYRQGAARSPGLGRGLGHTQTPNSNNTTLPSAASPSRSMMDTADL